MSLRDVRKLLDDKSPGEKALGALDTALSVIIALSPIGLGPAAMPLWTLLGRETARHGGVLWLRPPG